MTIQSTFLAIAGCLALTLPALSQQTIYSTTFDTLDGWTVTTGCSPGYSWAADATPAAPCWDQSVAPFMSPPASLNFNNGIDVGGPGHCPCGGGPGDAEITCGEVTSPPIELSGTHQPVLSFHLLPSIEAGCAWDLLQLTVSPASGGAPFIDECITLGGSTACEWSTLDFALEPLWGEVKIAFYFNTLDGWLNGGGGPFIDDLMVVGDCTASWMTHCVGEPKADGTPGARLQPDGSLSVLANEFRLLGDRFPANGFSTAFYGLDPAVLPAGNGVRCISGGLSYRLPLVATVNGAHYWRIDLTEPPLASGAIAGGSSWYFQSIYRDGTSFNFSDAIFVTFCD